MKQKIKEALQQGYKNLGLKDEVLERVAASVETFISDESDIQKFVDSELVKNLMKFEQAAADRKRAKQTKSAEGEGENEGGESNKTETKENAEAVPAWAQKLIEQNKTLTTKITEFETAQTQKSAVAALEKLACTWDYAKGYPEESKYAKSLAMGIYDGIGKTWSADELAAKYKEIFSERVKEKGVDTGQPFKSEGDASADALKSKFEAMAQRIKERQGNVAE